MKMKKNLSTILLLGGLTTISCLTAAAAETAFVLKSSAGIRDILVDNTGKRVALRLTSGEEIEGTVTMVGNSLVHISKLSGKEFYDAVVSIDSISAVIMRMRDR